MTKRREITPAPEPLEAYVEHFDEVLSKSNQREEFRHYLEGLLLPTERHKTLLVNVLRSEQVLPSNMSSCPQS